MLLNLQTPAVDAGTLSAAAAGVCSAAAGMDAAAAAAAEGHLGPGNSAAVVLAVAHSLPVAAAAAVESVADDGGIAWGWQWVAQPEGLQSKGWEVGQEKAPLCFCLDLPSWIQREKCLSCSRGALL